MDSVNCPGEETKLIQSERDRKIDDLVSLLASTQQDSNHGKAASWTCW